MKSLHVSYRVFPALKVVMSKLIRDNIFCSKYIDIVFD